MRASCQTVITEDVISRIQPLSFASSLICAVRSRLRDQFKTLRESSEISTYEGIMPDRMGERKDGVDTICARNPSPFEEGIGSIFRIMQEKLEQFYWGSRVIFRIFPSANGSFALLVLTSISTWVRVVWSHLDLRAAIVSTPKCEAYNGALP